MEGTHCAIVRSRLHQVVLVVVELHFNAAHCVCSSQYAPSVKPNVGCPHCSEREKKKKRGGKTGRKKKVAQYSPLLKRVVLRFSLLLIAFFLSQLFSLWLYASKHRQRLSFSIFRDCYVRESLDEICVFCDVKKKQEQKKDVCTG